MIFTATLTDRSIRGHYFLQDVQAENGMHRDHCWLQSSYVRLPPFQMPTRLEIDGKYRRYRPGPSGWTITRVRAVREVLPS
ncbi:MAG: hypothetical protein A4E48_00259 [Methanosaeta sp. PtaU1.Bin060]|nr:MAG: hypothetical protein A4E48_00259 [Methanosaeta sp. PtaU1.Bin060]